MEVWASSLLNERMEKGMLNWGEVKCRRKKKLREKTGPFLYAPIDPQGTISF